MNQLTERILALAAILILGVVWLHEHDVRVRNEARLQDELRSAKAVTVQWQAKYASASSVVVRDTVSVVRAIHRTDTLRTSVLEHLTDTVVVKQYVLATDSTVRACRDLVSDCAHFRVVADSTIQAVSHERDVALKLAKVNKPGFLRRCGFSAGYGAMLTGGQIRPGPVVSFGCKVWP